MFVFIRIRSNDHDSLHLHCPILYYKGFLQFSEVSRSAVNVIHLHTKYRQSKTRFSKCVRICCPKAVHDGFFNFMLYQVPLNGSRNFIEEDIIYL